MSDSHVTILYTCNNVFKHCSDDLTSQTQSVQTTKFSAANQLHVTFKYTAEDLEQSRSEAVLRNVPTSH